MNKTDWDNELSSWSDEDFIRIFHERPDLANRLRKILAEPVAADFPTKGKVYGPLGWIANNTNPEPVKCIGCEGPCSKKPAEPTPSQIRRARLRADPVKAAALDRAKERIAAELANSAEPVKVDAEASVPIDDLAHEIWAAAQTAPGEGIVDAVERIAALLARYGQYT